MKKISIKHSFFREHYPKDLDSFLELIQFVFSQIDCDDKDMLFLGIHELVINSFSEMTSYTYLDQFDLYFEFEESQGIRDSLHEIKVSIADLGKGLCGETMNSALTESFEDKNTKLQERGRGLKLVHTIADKFYVNVEGEMNIFTIEKGLVYERKSETDSVD